ncbi:hypothetical protein [Anaerotignum sp.]|uniref:hypothetical protein n=1 Tax=Anaerotignum sp. TaxID=2039241 RepID=UPI002714F25D|nr:hypothetical protein [Anaerotignum sp.]
MFLLSVGSDSVQQLEGKPQILPWFLGFLLAMFLLNLAISFFRRKKAEHHKKALDSKEEKQQKP